MGDGLLVALSVAVVQVGVACRCAAGENAAQSAVAFSAFLARPVEMPHRTRQTRLRHPRAQNAVASKLRRISE